jgi:hypothetical protein
MIRWSGDRPSVVAVRFARMRVMRRLWTFFVLAARAVALLTTGGWNGAPSKSRELSRKTGSRKLRQRSSRELPRPAD